jgi:hypothetical protein
MGITASVRRLSRLHERESRPVYIHDKGHHLHSDVSLSRLRPQVRSSRRGVNQSTRLGRLHRGISEVLQLPRVQDVVAPRLSAEAGFSQADWDGSRTVAKICAIVNT